MSTFIELLRSLNKEIKLCKIRAIHKKNNKHNFTTINYGNKSKSISIGKNTYGSLNYFDYHDGCSLNIGSYCSIADGVFFLMGGNHKMDTFSTFPFDAFTNGTIESYNKGNIIVEDDVWIGKNALILSGVKIGRGAIIGANTIVTKDVPPYAIVVGNPQKIIKYRFSQDIIEKIQTVNFEQIDLEDYKNSCKLLCQKVTNENVDEILESLKKKKKE